MSCISINNNNKDSHEKFLKEVDSCIIDNSPVGNIRNVSQWMNEKISMVYWDTGNGKNNVFKYAPVYRNL